jgi:hypothetical protein
VVNHVSRTVSGRQSYGRTGCACWKVWRARELRRIRPLGVRSHEKQRGRGWVYP